MDEALNFDIDMLFNLGYLFQTGLAAEHDTRQAFLFPERYGLPIEGGLLGAEMHLKSRYQPACSIDNGRVCHDNGGNSGII
ncbi:hypothetical protein D3C79_860060 [compost metagenome]